MLGYQACQVAGDLNLCGGRHHHRRGINGHPGVACYPLRRDHRIRQGGKEALDKFLKTNAKYHNRLVSVAGSAQLTDAFRRLGIGTVWREALNSEE